jgi:nucleotide-binding universal stress UspA family protein
MSPHDVRPRSILAAVDFSDESRHALRWAGELSARLDARLAVLSVVDPLLADAAKIKLGHDLAADTAAALRAFVRETWPGDDGLVSRTTSAVRVGHAADAILQTADGEAIGLLVMGTQGLGGLRKWILGSTTQRVLRRARVPVLAVPLAAGASIDVRRVLVATDFSPAAAAAVPLAAELASRYSASLIFAHAVEPVAVPPHLTPAAAPSNEDRATAARVRLAALAAEGAGRIEHDAAVAIGRASDVIPSIAAERSAGLIVMGLTGEAGPFAPRPGSIAYRVLASSAVPVLVVPPGPPPDEAR